MGELRELKKILNLINSLKIILEDNDEEFTSTSSYDLVYLYLSFIYDKFYKEIKKIEKFIRSIK